MINAKTPMTSFLILSQESEKGHTLANKCCETLKIHPIDRHLVEKMLDEKTGKAKQSIGIEQIKTMQKQLFLKPIQSNEKAIILLHAELLTIEAQNALLKVLEEPPIHTRIFLITENLDEILPTIISRCKVMTVAENIPSLAPSDYAFYKHQLETMPTYSVAQCLEEAEQMSRSKDGALLWLHGMMLTGRQVLLEKVSESRGEPENMLHISRMMQVFNETFTILKTTNANVRLVCESMFLRIANSRDK